MESNDLFKDMLKDAKHQRLLSTVIIIILSIAVVVLGIALFKVSAHCQDQIKETSMHCQDLLKEMSLEYEKQMVELLSETEFSTEYQIDTDGNSFNTGNITVNK